MTSSLAGHRKPRGFTASEWKDVLAAHQCGWFGYTIGRFFWLELAAAVLFVNMTWGLQLFSRLKLEKAGLSSVRPGEEIETFVVGELSAIVLCAAVLVLYRSVDYLVKRRLVRKLTTAGFLHASGKAPP